MNEKKIKWLVCYVFVFDEIILIAPLPRSEYIYVAVIGIGRPLNTNIFQIVSEMHEIGDFGISSQNYTQTIPYEIDQVSSRESLNSNLRSFESRDQLKLKKLDSFSSHGKSAPG